MYVIMSPSSVVPLEKFRSKVSRGRIGAGTEYHPINVSTSHV